jgi:hypothetical protein
MLQYLASRPGLCAWVPSPQPSAAIEFCIPEKKEEEGGGEGLGFAAAIGAISGARSSSHKTG